jgi:hypothetical protein
MVARQQRMVELRACEDALIPYQFDEPTYLCWPCKLTVPPQPITTPLPVVTAPQPRSAFELAMLMPSRPTTGK